ncbi:uncharacterized protein [Littorina saxatilis]|uniref:AIG1-type G domain-containing protein n=1 Tax=Littorina saxatilis TaxID=31220 RepID=A0AAN9G397_9CAEN
MDGAAGLKSWASREGLPAEIVSVLQEQGFTSLDQVKSDLEPDDIKTYFQDTGLLKVAQCLALKKAVKRFAGAADRGSRCPPQANGSHPQPFPASSYPYSSVPQPSANMYPPLPPHSQPQPGPMRYPSAEQPQPGPMRYPSAEQHYPTAAGCAGAMPGLNLSSAGTGQNFTFLLLGKTGSGKSTTGNTIFGEKLFNTAATFASVTSECERKTSCRNGRKVEIIDSPGLYDTHKTQEEICVTIVQAVAGMHPGPHAILYVVRLGRYTAEEYGAYTRLKALFDEDITKYMIILFTYGDMLERERKSIEELIGSEAPEDLKKVLRECNNRYIVFNNMAYNPQTQVEHLLSMARHIVAQNGGKTYSCPKYGQIGQGMEEEVARRLQEVEKKDLQRQKYVQQLEKQTQEAEQKAEETKAQMEKNERERQRRMDEEEEKRRQLKDQLHSHIKEQQDNAKKHQEELHRLQREREEQEKMMREKEHEMSEKEKKRAEEEAAMMREREAEMREIMRQTEERFARQREDDEDRRHQMEKDRQQFMLEVEEQRRKEREELEEREAERQKLFEEKLADERAEAKKKQELYEKEMEDLKQSHFKKQQASEWVTKGIGFIFDAVKIGLDIYTLTKDGKTAGKETDTGEKSLPSAAGSKSSTETKPPTNPTGGKK